MGRLLGPLGHLAAASGGSARCVCPIMRKLNGSFPGKGGCDGRGLGATQRRFLIAESALNVCSSSEAWE